MSYRYEFTWAQYHKKKPDVYVKWLYSAPSITVQTLKFMAFTEIFR